MKSYAKGRRFEYRVRNELRGQGWFVFRSAGSKGVFDLLAVRKEGGLWLIECKVRKRSLTKQKREGIVEMAERMGAVPVLAYMKEARRPVIYEDLRSRKTEAGIVGAAKDEIHR